MLGTLGSFSQIKKVRPKKCYTDEYQKEIEKKNPSVETKAQFEQWIKGKIAQKALSRDLNDVTNYAPLPVIFHIIHTGQAVGTGYNISQARVQAQLIQLNKDFANLSGSPYSVSSNTGLQFCLAQTNASGTVLAQPGIDRINVSSAAYGQPPYTVNDFDNKVKSATIWDPTKYINIWITEFDGGEGVLGYSTFPGSSTLDGLDNAETAKTAGVVIDYSTVGSRGMPSAECGSGNVYNTGRTLTHELGHYFGLRHIWGDTQCGDDYCDDTPVHEAANYGAPSHPKPNNCGTTDEMFENYMDYTDDNILNTFTLNQADRMQLVMLNSPRRKTLPTSTAGCGTSVNNATIAFIPCAATLGISEKSTQTASCPNYTDVKLFLNIEDKATSAATLTVSTTGTATKVADYEIINPVISIAAGDSYKEITVRIFDDAVAEGNETIIISYSISGSGVVASASQPQQFTINILDDDNVTISQNSKTIYTEDFGTTGATVPTGWSQSYYGDAPTNKWTVSGNAGITGQSLHITNNTTTKPFTYTVTKTSYPVAQTPIITAGSYKKINLSFNYKVAGEQDADGLWDYGKVMISTADAPASFSDIPSSPKLVGTYNSATGNVTTVTGSVSTAIPYNLYNGGNFYLNYYWENDDNSGTQPPLAIDDILVTGSHTKIESQLGHSKEINLAATSQNFIVSKEDEEIIAAVNKSSASIACLNASIAQTGTGQVDVNVNGSIFKRSEKVIKMSPASVSTATYDITIYFTTSELAGWSDINQLQVLKVQDGVSLTSVLNSSNATLYLPVISDKRADDGYASFTVSATGFSQFMLVEKSATLPLQLLNFTVTGTGAGASLAWSTASEYNNKGFTIEKSLDGINFSAIGFVAGKGQTTPGNFDYSYLDNNLQKGITYYYRLLQTDLNGNIAYSSLQTLRLSGENTSLIVYPNPVKTVAHLITDKAISAALNLITINGKTVWSQAKKTITGNIDVPVANLPAGVYLLQVLQDGNQQTFKIIKE